MMGHNIFLCRINNKRPKWPYIAHQGILPQMFQANLSPIISNGSGEFYFIFFLLFLVTATILDYSAKNIAGVTVLILYSTSRLMLLYICTKFNENILDGIKVIEQTRFLLEKFQRGTISQKGQSSIEFWPF